jgi:glycosylphosphatidylinositol transamidase (GPIT) subunit GPI8
VLYITGHGGDGSFRMSETEVLKAEDLASWLNGLQQMMPGLVTLVYDACESGSFISRLAPPPPGRQRITITSTSP